MKMDSFSRNKRTIKINNQREKPEIALPPQEWSERKKTWDVEKNQYDYFVYATCTNPRLPHKKSYTKKPTLSFQNVWSLGTNILP